MNMLKVEKLGWAAYVTGGHAGRREVGRRQRPDEGHDHVDRPDEPGLVHLQPALADHAVPDGVGHLGDRSEGRQRGMRNGVLRDGGRDDRQEEHEGHAGLRGREVLRGRVRVSLEAVRLRSEEPQGAEQLAQDLRDEPALAGRRRPVAPDPVRLGRERDDGAQPEVLGPGEAEDRQVRPVAVHLERGGVQRARRRQDRRRLSARTRISTVAREEPARQPGKNHPRLVEASTSTRGTRGASTTSPKLQLDW